MDVPYFATVRFPEPLTIASISTLGSGVPQFYTGQYRLEWKNSLGETSYQVATKVGGDPIFVGSASDCEPVQQDLVPAIQAIELRIVPLQWGFQYLGMNAPGLRFDTNVCQESVITGGRRRRLEDDDGRHILNWNANAHNNKNISNIDDGGGGSASRDLLQTSDWCPEAITLTNQNVVPKVIGFLDPPTSTAKVSGVCNSGDVNGDGYPDIAVGNYNYNAGGITDSGAMMIYFGSATGYANYITNTLPGGFDGTMLRGSSTYHYVSRHGMAMDGDLNGDGYDDIIVYSSAGNTEIFVIFGRSTGWSSVYTSSSITSGSIGTRFLGISAARANRYPAFLGNVNGDFHNSNPLHDVGFCEKTDPGKCYVVFGKSSGWGTTTSYTSLNGVNGFSVTNSIDSTPDMYRINRAGDVNGDGIDDLMITGETAITGTGGSQGEVYIIFGKTSGWSSNVDVAALDGTDGFIAYTSANRGIGRRISPAGDMNGDGFDDVIVNSQLNSRRVYVIYGRSTFPAKLEMDANSNGANGYYIESPGSVYFGATTMSGGKDVNGDGLSDIVVDDITGGLDGLGYVFYGKASTPYSSFTTNDLVKIFKIL